MANGGLVRKDLLFGKCSTLECEYEFVSLQLVFVTEEQEVVRALCDAWAVRGRCLVDSE